MAIDFDPSIDHYKALGVAATASAEEIKKAYRKLAKQFHPDSTGGDKKKEARFKEVSNAYDVVGDAKKRAQYDQVRAYGPRTHAGAGFAGAGPGAEQVDMNDLFSQFFGGGMGGGGGRVRVEHFGGGGRRRPEPEPERPAKLQAADGSWLTVTGQDVHSDIRLPFDQAMLGTVATVATIDGKAEVKIPPGTSSGRKLRLRGKGIAERGGAAGDHYVTVHIDVPAITDDADRKVVTQLANKTRKGGRTG